MRRRSHGFAVIDGGRVRGGRHGRATGARRKVRRPGLFVVILAGLVAAPLDGTAPRPADLAEPSAPRCRILSVADGDTLRVECPGRGVEPARLVGFDTPELFSPRCATEKSAAERARRALSAMIGAADDVAFVREGEDRYGRGLVRLYLDGKPVSRAMIDAGHARPYNGGSRGGWCGQGQTPRP